jgi:hypothetical protein
LGSSKQRCSGPSELNMIPVERLKQLVGSIDPATLPSPSNWSETESILGLVAPDSFKQLINDFGHGTWGRDLIFLHPKGTEFQSLRRGNLVKHRSVVDPKFQALMPGDAPAKWAVIPIALLPYNCTIFQDLKSEEVIVYDGDYSEHVMTGCIGPAEFILKSLQWREIELPRDWKSFAEANWSDDMPVFTSRCRKEPDGFHAMGPSFGGIV